MRVAEWALAVRAQGDARHIATAPRIEVNATPHRESVYLADATSRIHSAIRMGRQALVRRSVTSVGRGRAGEPPAGAGTGAAARVGTERRAASVYSAGHDPRLRCAPSRRRRA